MAKAEDLRSTEAKLAALERLRDEALHSGDERAVARQRERGKLLARERLEKLLDPGSFVELDRYVRHRNPHFGMMDKRPWGDAVAESPLPGHVEVVALVDDELVDLHERPGVQQQLEPLARRLLAGLVLAADSLVTAGELGLHVTASQILESLVARHQASSFIDFRLIFHQ